MTKIATIDIGQQETRKLLDHLHNRLVEKANRRNKVDVACPPAEYCPDVRELAMTIDAVDLADLKAPILAGLPQERIEAIRDFNLQEVLRKFPRLVKRYRK
jgi:hypothetical protein